MSANQADYPISIMASAFGVSAAGFYAWRKREPSKRAQEDEQLAEQIEAIHEQSRGIYGAPRIYEELKDAGRRHR